MISVAFRNILSARMNDVNQPAVSQIMIMIIKIMMNDVSQPTVSQGKEGQPLVCPQILESSSLKLHEYILK